VGSPAPLCPYLRAFLWLQLYKHPYPSSTETTLDPHSIEVRSTIETSNSLNESSQICHYLALILDSIRQDEHHLWLYTHTTSQCGLLLTISISLRQRIRPCLQHAHHVVGWHLRGSVYSGNGHLRCVTIYIQFCSRCHRVARPMVASQAPHRNPEISDRKYSNGFILWPWRESPMTTSLSNSWKKSTEKAIPVFVSVLFQTGRAIDAAYTTYRTVPPFSARMARQVKPWLAQHHPAPITWDFGHTEIKVPTMNTWARLDIKALSQAYDMLVKCSEVFRQLNQQERIDIIHHIAKILLTSRTVSATSMH